MKLMANIKSRLFIKPIVLNWTVGILVVCDIFLLKYIPKDVRPTVEIALTCIYFILFLWAIFYFLFKTFDKWDLDNQIATLEEEKGKSLKYFGKFSQEDLLLKYKNVTNTLTDNNNFIHIIKSKEELTNTSNIGNYLKVLLIFFVGQFFFDYLQPLGPIVFISLIFLCTLFCIRILIWEVIKKKNFASPIIMGHALAIYLLFACGKNSFIRSYGDEIICSYFEKSEYRTKYYVNVFPDDERSENYRLPAVIYVNSETEEGETSEDRFGQEHTNTYTTKYIRLEKVYWANGAYLNFDNCQLEMGDKVLCRDQNERKWYIELTKEKVK